AAWQGFMAVRNAYLPLNEKGVLDLVPRSTFTDSEVAHTGLTEAQARSKFGQGALVCNWPLEKVDRALTDGDATGFVKLIHKANGTILGVTMAAPRAGEMIKERSLAIDQGLKIGALANSIHVYPT
ncbi:MAG: pyridine nucleotide-disulfide oxidoreductase, partial [Dehalococcoidia bacterium]|nr:pyridine nucleotide-disulfide oxidoreductase [Dehalococcoidia bacterium]